jgi:hypothetical protein
MVQLSIDEDLLRYHRTLLIWVPSSNKVSSDVENIAKLNTIQHTIIEILRESKEGMSLAQLPLYIKRKLTFPLDLAELGFAKLKDLLSTMPEVEIELRGANHPFAVFKSKRKRVNEEELKNTLTDILNEYSRGLPGPKLENMLSLKLGYFINWTQYKCTSIYEFVEKKTVGTFEVLEADESKVIVRAKSKSSGSLKHSGIENYAKGGVVIKINNGLLAEESTTEESNGINHIKALSMQYLNNSDTYTFDAFQYRNPPGFN